MQPNEHKYSLIWLHGLGDTAIGFYDVFTKHVDLPDTCKVILPTAPVRKVTVNMGMEMPAWFDIIGDFSDSDLSKTINQDQVSESVTFLTTLIQEEAKLLGNDPSRVFIGGFS